MRIPYRYQLQRVLLAFFQIYCTVLFRFDRKYFLQQRAEASRIERRYISVQLIPEFLTVSFFD